MPDSDFSNLLPIPPAQLHILLALADGQKHGYAIMTEVETITDGAVTMGPGTLYGAIKRMIHSGIISEAEERPDPELDDQRRRYYQITVLGVGVLDAEIARMEHLASAGRRRRASTRRGAEGEGV